ncbi:MAG: transposase [Candidatus Peribacteraceae bacterium]|nr:transposase [Candidatus Peribacteraceae bacterium]
MSLHRGSQKRFYDEELSYVVTVNTGKKLPFFKERTFCDLWIEELRLCKKLKKFELYGFCLSYDHFHVMLNPREANVSEVIRSFKTNFSRNANRILGFFEMINKKGVLVKARSRDLAFRALDDFEIVKNLRKKFIRKYGKDHDFPKFKWQKSFHDHFLRGEQDFQNQLNYVIYNYTKHNLPKIWEYTSLNFPELLDEA